MSNIKTIKIFDKYLMQKMDQAEITDFKNMLSKDAQLKQDFYMHRAVYVTAQKHGRQEMRNRFSQLERERTAAVSGPSQTICQTSMANMAAFMYQSSLDSTSLPVTDDTISDFLQGEEE